MAQGSVQTTGQSVAFVADFKINENSLQIFLPAPKDKAAKPIIFISISFPLFCLGSGLTVAFIVLLGELLLKKTFRENVIKEEL